MFNIAIKRITNEALELPIRKLNDQETFNTRKMWDDIDQFLSMGKYIIPIFEISELEHFQ